MGIDKPQQAADLVGLLPTDEVDSLMNRQKNWFLYVGMLEMREQ